MTNLITRPLCSGAPSFLGAPVLDDIQDIDTAFAVIGAPFGVPYDIRKVHYGAADAPQAVREISNRYGAMQDRYDIDLGGEPFAGLPHPLRDLGDVHADPSDFPGNSNRVSQAVRLILARGAKPIVLGGDDSTTWMAIRGFDEQPAITILQIDAHIDFRDEVGGIREGYSSPMRRASEARFVNKIVHVGTRGPGSARRQDHEATLAAGNSIVTAREVRKAGVEAVLAHIPDQSRVYVALDVDGLDPSVTPGTSAPLPGGLDFIEVQDIIFGLCRDHEIVGFNVAEHYPSLDVNGITSLVITRLIANWIGLECQRACAG